MLETTGWSLFLTRSFQADLFLAGYFNTLFKNGQNVFGIDEHFINRYKWMFYVQLVNVSYCLHSLSLHPSLLPLCSPVLEPAVADTTPYPNALFVHPYVGGPLLKLGMGQGRQEGWGGREEERAQGKQGADKGAWQTPESQICSFRFKRSRMWKRLKKPLCTPLDPLISFYRQFHYVAILYEQMST